jgi:hypothetical protein
MYKTLVIKVQVYLPMHDGGFMERSDVSLICDNTVTTLSQLKIRDFLRRNL